MQAAQQTPQLPPKRNADPMKREACVVLIVRFVDQNAKTFYSRDIEYNDWRRGHVGYWTTRYQKMIEEESPKGWKGRVDQAAIFHCYDGNRGDKICQFSKPDGWKAAGTLPS